MRQTPVQMTFVSNTTRIGYADAAEAAEALVGQEVAGGSARLEIKQRTAEGLAGATWFSGVLRTGSRLAPAVPVDVVVAPWSAYRTEIGIRPLGRLGALDSARTRRFLDAAWAVLPALIERLGAQTPALAEVTPDLRVAA